MNPGRVAYHRILFNPLPPKETVRMTKLYAAAKVILAAAPTYFVAVAAGLTIASGTLAEVAPESWQTTLAWAIRVAAWLTTAAQIVRRVTPVPKTQRGLLPQD